MTVPAKLALPVASGLIASQMSMDGAIGNRWVLVSAPPGCLMTRQLARQLAARQPTASLQPVTWLRLGSEDEDPAALLLDLAAGAETMVPGAAAHTLETMRRQPGSVFGWPSLYEMLAGDLSEAIQSTPGIDHPVVVIEHANVLFHEKHGEFRHDRPETFSLLCQHYLALLPRKSTCILTQHATGRGNRFFLPGNALHLGTTDLRFDSISALTLARQAGVNLPISSLQRFVELTEGRATAIVLLLELAQAGGCPSLNACIQGATSLDDLLGHAFRHTIANATASQRLMFALALQLDYLHPDLLQMVSAQISPMERHWLQNLTGGWIRMPCITRAAVASALTVDRDGTVRDALRRAQWQSVEFFLQRGMVEQAVTTLFQLGLDQEAAQVLTQVAETMLDRGQWETLSGWITRLPERVRHDWPWLLYYEGEIAAACGREQTARRSLSHATRLFAAKGELTGVCQSLLTQSSLSALHNHPQESQQFAQQLFMVAESGKLPWYQGWAGWQLGCIAAISGQVDEALANFRRAVDTAAALNDPHMTAFINEAKTLAQTKVEQQKILASMERTIQATTTRLMEIARDPAEGSAGLLSHYGWSRTPLLLKLPHSIVKSQHAGILPNWFMDLISPPAQPFPEPSASPSLSPAAVERLSELPPVLQQAQCAEFPPYPIRADAGAPAPGLASAVADAIAPIPVTADPEMQAAGPVKAALPAPAAPDTVRPPAVPAIHAFLLGEFRVLMNEAVIENWPGGRGRAIFAFLLIQHCHSAHREVLMDTFWPDSEPDAARNNLNVAIHNLRGVFRQEYDRPVIVRDENSYRIDPALDLWLDFSAFEQHVRAGGQVEMGGCPAGAIAEYEAAIQLYQGDFLADHPFEEWAILERERLRVMYLETLDRLSLLHFNEGNYRACIRLCQRMVTYDACREDAHCRLMRCYYYEGQAHLALRQYQVCVEALRNELAVGPSPATVDLYDQIRRRKLE